MRGLLLALALASFALPIAAQTPCDADPRWIVVTVVRFEWTNADGQRNVALTDIVLGELLFDRCEGRKSPWVSLENGNRQLKVSRSG